MYTKFDFEKFERSRVIASKTLATLDVLDVLDEQVVDFPKYCNRLNDSEKMLVEERVAIIEFDGGLSCDEAEFLALEEIIRKN